MSKLETPPRDAFRALLARAASVVRLVRPVDPPLPPYKACAGCGHGGRDDQHVPDPDQFVKVRTADGAPGTEKTEGDIKVIDAAPVWCAHCLKWYHAIGCYSTHKTRD